MNLLQNILSEWTKKLDPRVADLPLIASFYQVPFIIFAYLYFVLSYGPRFMKNRPPYSLKKFIKLYNIVQILINAWLIYDYLDSGLFSIKLMCPTLDYSYNYIPMRITRCLWYYFLLKILDYVETGIFVLRKKDTQVTALHLYHHVSTFLLAWITLRYYAIPPIALMSIINSFIHTIMYTYYLLAAWGPNVQKAVAPIKRWITILQMVQFIVMILYGLQYILSGCKVTNYFIFCIYMGNVLINFYMFYNFYQKTYTKLKKTQ
ncbi:elongation of very long chain fatty acids protein AAEL008004 [Mycetomoellerius zeteki]|uniref:elongation of very long chain fatty acids protein AAEL008004 n=1 Tax=Mycetomoellerius zeteki TaxID=64791 RepID=UPI00084E39AC|nr:PREDICTED: elongation of very long chain fatty acids protein AAEL008004-like [Trachymyrmex zeteki]